MDKYDVTKSFKSILGHVYEFNPYLTMVTTLNNFITYTKSGPSPATYSVTKIPQYVGYTTDFELIFDPLSTALPASMYGDSWTLSNPPYIVENSGSKLWSTDANTQATYTRVSFLEYL